MSVVVTPCSHKMDNHSNIHVVNTILIVGSDFLFYFLYLFSGDSTSVPVTNAVFLSFFRHTNTTTYFKHRSVEPFMSFSETISNLVIDWK